jgi:hypothetical protein
MQKPFIWLWTKPQCVSLPNATSNLQALVPKLEGVVSQRAQLINVAEQVAALQTAFNMLSHGNR